MEVYLRLDEDGKTAAQRDQRDATYMMAKQIRALGYKCEVREWFTGGEKYDAAGIVLTLDQFE